MTTVVTLSDACSYMQAGETYIPAYTYTVAGEPVECEALAVTFDEGGEDYITVAAQSAPIAADARLSPPAQLELSIEFPDRGASTSPVNLELVYRSGEQATTATSSVFKSSCQGWEARIRDDAAAASRAFTASDTVVGAVTSVIHSVIPAASIISAIPSGTRFLTGADTLTWTPQTQQWGLVTQICDAAIDTICECFFDGTAFVLRPTPTVTSAAYYFTDTTNVAEWVKKTSRDTFFNAVQVPLLDGSTITVESSHPTYGTAAAGRRLKILTTALSQSSSLARARGDAFIRRSIQSGLTATLKTPDMPIGLMPGATVETLIGGVSETWIVSAITLDIAAGGSEITLRKDI